MIPYKSNRPYAVPQTLEKPLEIVRGIRTLFEQYDVTKASPDDLQHLGWPAGSPDGKGGEFRPKTVVPILRPPPFRECLKLNVRPGTKKIWPFADARVWMHVMVKRWHATQRVPQVTRFRRSISRDDRWSLQIAY